MKWYRDAAGFIVGLVLAASLLSRAAMGPARNK
jgi:hypothetical protein